MQLYNPWKSFNIQYSCKYSNIIFKHAKNKILPMIRCFVEICNDMLLQQIDYQPIIDACIKQRSSGVAKITFLLKRFGEY